MEWDCGLQIYKSDFEDWIDEPPARNVHHEAASLQVRKKTVVICLVEEIYWTFHVVIVITPHTTISWSVTLFSVQCLILKLSFSLFLPLWNCFGIVYFDLNLLRNNEQRGVDIITRAKLREMQTLSHQFICFRRLYDLKTTSKQATFFNTHPETLNYMGLLS